MLAALGFGLFFLQTSNAGMNNEIFSGPTLIPTNVELPIDSYEDSTFIYWTPNLEPQDYRDRPPFLAPKGTSNVALNKPVTSSAPTLHGKLKQITDGNKHYERTSLVELPEGQQWVQIDLEKEHTIYAILLWHFHEGGAVYFDVIVQVSSSDDFSNEVTTVYNNDYDNSSRLGTGKDKEYIENYKGRLMDTHGAVGRYIRFYSDGSCWDGLNHYVEIEIYGLPKDSDDSEKSGVNHDNETEENKNIDDQELVPIEIELPEPFFGGRPLSKNFLPNDSFFSFRHAQSSNLATWASLRQPNSVLVDL